MVSLHDACAVPFSDHGRLGNPGVQIALEDSIGRAHHYGAIARDALALFPDSAMKSALAETVDFCIARTH
jgi:hypothetical protein